MKKTLVIVMVLLACTYVNAQNKTSNSLTYKTSAGVRVWDGGGLNLKTFIDNKTALEFIGFFNGDGSRITGLYEFHGDLNTEGNLKWYIGPGATVGFYDKKTIIGINGVIGLDFKFKDLPLNVAVDWQPGFQFGSGYGYVGNWFGGAVRYTF